MAFCDMWWKSMEAWRRFWGRLIRKLVGKRRFSSCEVWNVRKSRTKCSFWCSNMSRLDLWFSSAVAGSMGKVAKPLLVEGFKTGCNVVSRGRRGTLWHSDVFRHASNNCFVWHAQHFCVIVRRWIAFFVAGATLWTCRVACFLRIALSAQSPVVTLNNPDSTFHTPHFTLQTWHFTPHTLHSTLHTLHSLHTPHFTPHTLHSTLYTLHVTLTLYTPLFTLCTPHFTLPFSSLITMIPGFVIIRVSIQVRGIHLDFFVLLFFFFLVVVLVVVVVINPFPCSRVVSWVWLLGICCCLPHTFVSWNDVHYLELSSCPILMFNGFWCGGGQGGHFFLFHDTGSAEEALNN